MLINQTVVIETARYVKDQLKEERSGHDWWHVYRVWQLAKYIAQYEKAELLIVELAALLHDIADWKHHDGDLEIGPKTAREWLRSFNLPEMTLNKVATIIREISFKGAGEATQMTNIETQIVQDADRLDALGAIGIARVFTFGGYIQQPMYDPNIQPSFHRTFEDYKNKRTTAINHFYEKLLLLKDRMNTKTGKKLARMRHQFLEDYLKQFKDEWSLMDAQVFDVLEME